MACNQQYYNKYSDTFNIKNNKLSKYIKNKNYKIKTEKIFNYLFANFIRKLKNFSKKSKNSWGNNSSNSASGKNVIHIVLSILAILSIYIISGFYTIKEAENGVILRFGKFYHIVKSGINWKPIFIDTVIPVNVEDVREISTSGLIFTLDENILNIEINVQYRVIDIKNYLFNVNNADDILSKTIDSAIRCIIGRGYIDKILTTEGRTGVINDIKSLLEVNIQPYNMGINILDIKFHTYRPPYELNTAFTAVVLAQKKEKKYIHDAEIYSNKVQSRAKFKVQHIRKKLRFYKISTILESQGKVLRLTKLFSKYKIAPQITKNYI